MRTLAVLGALSLVCLLPTAAAAAEVKVLGGFFDPDVLQVSVGEEIAFTNEDSMPHTVTSTWDEGETFDVVLRNGETFTWTVPAAGEYAIHCRPHAYPGEDGGAWEGMVMTVEATVGGSANIGDAADAVPGPGVALLVLSALGGAMLLRKRRA